MPKWTDAQNNAIIARGSNLLVSAAAGSGKTAVLVERIIRLLIEDMIDIDKLLIVTFTNAAAGEMRERILEALTKEIDKGTDKEEYLRRQITLLNKASITTVHSFCIDVVRRNFHHIGIDPVFRIGDTTEINILIQETLEEILEGEYERAEADFIDLVEGFGDNREDIKLQELILRIYSFIQSKPYPLVWLEEVVEEFNSDLDKLKKSKWIKIIKDSIRIDLMGARDQINEAMDVSNRINGPVQYKEALKIDLVDIEGLLKILEEDDLDSFYRAINRIEHPNLKRVTKDVDKDLKEEAQKLRKTYKDSITSIKSGLLSKGLDKYLEELNTLYPIMKHLYKLVASFSRQYREKKQEKGILDFSDLEHYTLEILEDEEIRKDFTNRFQYIFVDEYQDSNIVQETIVNRIKRENNLFFVGDVKQSIYKFRLADPTLFIEKYEGYSTEFGSIHRRIDLSQNFRSREEIIHGVNFIFENIMSKDLGEIDYDERAYLYKGAEYKEIDDPSIELNLIEREIGEDQELEEELEEMEDIEVEAAIVAKRIKGLIGKRTYNAKTGQYKEIDYKDMVILLRTMKNWSSVFMDTLIREGIPVYADDSSGYFDVLEIKIFLDLLSIVDNKRQDKPLLSTMKSPIGRFTTEELIKIRLVNRNGSYFEAIESYIKNNVDDLQIKLKEFLRKLDLWAEESRYLKLDEFIWKLLIETGYYHYVGAMPGGIQRQGNLRILVDRASQFEKTSINGLFNFIRFIDKLQSSSGDMGTAKTLSENENVVRIMSIHKSKGLEFPVVICAGLGKNFNLMDTRGDILLHKDLGIGPKFVDVEKRTYTETLPKIAIKKKMKLESLSEEMRVLYVALTRPKDKLILVGSAKKIENESKRWCKGPKPYNLINSKNYLDWICSCLSIHRDGEPIRNLAGVTLEGYNFDNEEKSRWTINLLSRTDLTSMGTIDGVSKKEYKDKLTSFKGDKHSGYLDIIKGRLDWSYDYTEASKIPSKLSVSDIKKSSRKSIDNLAFKIPSLVKMPKFLEGKKPFTKAEKGTIVHFVMQHLDMKNISSEESIKQQVDMMVINELLTDEEAKVVDITKIIRFFKGDIGRRVLSAGEVYREAPFVLRKTPNEVIADINDLNEELLIQGIIDCYFEEEGELVLIDYKTDSILSGSLDEIVDKYKTQMELYKEALEKITEKKVKESYIYSFELDKEVKVE